MEDSKNSAYYSLPKLAVVCSFNLLSITLVELLNKNSCQVIVFTEDVRKWKEVQSKKRIDGSLISIISSGENPLVGELDYLICLSYQETASFTSSVNLDLLKRKITTTCNLGKRYQSKTLFVFSYSQNEKVNHVVEEEVDRVLSDKDLYSGAIYLGDILGLKENLLLNTPGHLFYPISSEKAANEIIKSLFSLRVYGKKIAVISKPLGVGRLKKILIDEYPNIDFLYNNIRGEKMMQEEVDGTVYINEDVERMVRKSIDLIKENLKGRSLPKVVIERNARHKSEVVKRHRKKIPNLVSPRMLQKSDRTKESFFAEIKPQNVIRLPRLKPGKIFRWTTLFVNFIFLLLVTPLFLLIASVASLKLSKWVYSSGKFETARFALDTSNILATTSSDYSMFFTKLNFINKPYRYLIDSSGLVKRASRVGIMGLKTTETLIDLSEDMVGDVEYDLTGFSNELSLELDLLYKELGFLQTDMQVLKPFSGWIVKSVGNEIDIETFRKKILLVRKLTIEIPETLGRGKPVTYLILFQNNTILRPTGGLIDSYASLTFNNGNLTDFQIFNTKFADTNLTGIVEAPHAIKKYLGETTWYLRDSNWDPNFQTSAVKAEWFLDKEVGLAFDGVIAVDLEFIKMVMSALGGIQLGDTNTLVDSHNLYELFNAQLMDENYPSSDEVGLYERIIDGYFSKLDSIDRIERFKLVKSVIDSVDKKHLQIFLHDQEVQRIISELNWDGGINALECQNNCYSDPLGVVEVNIGSGNSHLIKREFQFSAFLQEGLIKRDLKIFIENPTNDSYNAYFRVMTNADSGFSEVEVFEEGKKELLMPDLYGAGGFKEAGVAVELKPRQTKALVFNWESGSGIDFGKEGRYLLYLRKQSGTPNNPIEIRIGIPKDIQIASDQPFTLTKEGLFEYNGLLSKDFISNIYWNESDKK
jgi:hypothetical protein